jgi:hypothetical protein
MRFSDNPEKNNAVIWFVIAAIFFTPPVGFGRFYPAVLLGGLSFLGIVMGLAFYVSSRKYDSLVSGEDVLARWSYRYEEIASTLAEEEKRQKKMRMVVLFFYLPDAGYGCSVLFW